MVVLRHGPLALENLDEHRGLVVLIRRENLRTFRGDDSVPVDEVGHDTSNRLDTLGIERSQHNEEKKGMRIRTVRKCKMYFLTFTSPTCLVRPMPTCNVMDAP